MLRLVLIVRSQFFHNLRHFSSQAKERSTTHLLGITLKVCSSLRFATSTTHPRDFFTPLANFSPVYPPSTSTFSTLDKSSLFNENASKAPSRSVTFAVVI